VDHSALTPAAPRGASFRLPHPNRRTLVKGVAWSAPVLAIATTAPALAVSLLDDAQARAFLLSGNLGGVIGLGEETNPDLVEVSGVHAIATNHTATDEQANPLALSVLEAIDVNLDGLAGALSTILTAATDTPLGAVNQYAFAAKASDGPADAEVGGAGAVSENGTIDLQYNGSAGPSLATLQLSHVLAQLAGDGVSELVSSVSDLTLDIGAVAGRAQMNSPTPVPVSAVERDYLLAYLHLLGTSNLVSALGSALNDTAPINLTVDAGPILDLLEGALGGLVSASAVVSATLDARQFTGEDPVLNSGAISLDLADGELTIDVAPLLGHAFPGADGSLNGLAPNSRLFVDAGLPGAGITDVTESLKKSLIDRLGKFVAVDISVSAVLLVLPVEVLTVRGTLEDLLSGNAEVRLLNGLTGNILPETLRSVGALVSDALSALLDGNGAIALALQGVNGLLSSLFTVLSDPDILTITVNAQNNPVNGAGPVPSYYQGLPEGRFDVAALHLEAAGFIDLLNVSLGRGSVGENTPSSVGQSRSLPSAQ
jgi:hypothetical protein